MPSAAVVVVVAGVRHMGISKLLTIDRRKEMSVMIYRQSWRLAEPLLTVGLYPTASIALRPYRTFPYVSYDHCQLLLSVRNLSTDLNTHVVLSRLSNNREARRVVVERARTTWPSESLSSRRMVRVRFTVSQQGCARLTSRQSTRRCRRCWATAA